jgi:hypothetical protein
MRLRILYESMTVAERCRLAKAANINPGYLWQIATGWRDKRASIDVIARLVAADGRLTASELLAEFSDRPKRRTASPGVRESSHA